MSSRYQPCPQTPPAPTVAVISGSVSTKTGTKYIWMQYRNRVGYSLVSTMTTVTVAASEGLQITVPTPARPSPDGTDIHRFVILMSESSNVLNACVVAEFDGYETDGVTKRTLPLSLNLTHDEHFKLSQSVANVAALPSQKVVGTHRQLTDTSSIVRWNGTAWDVAKPQAFNTYTASTTAQYGSDVDLAVVASDQILTLDYDVDSGIESIPIGYALANTGTVVQPKGTRIGFSVFLEGEDAAESFATGGLTIELIGYVNTVTGVLDTTGEGGIGTMAGVGVEVPYLGKSTGLSLPKDLPAGQAVVLVVRLNTTQALLGYKGVYGSGLRITPFFQQNLAQVSPGGKLFGSFIAAESGKRRIVPATGLEAIVLDGTGQIDLPGINCYVFSNVGVQPVLSLAANTANQKVGITINGTCLIAPTAPSTTVALRAIVGTLNTVSAPTGWNGSISLNSSNLLRVTVTYPTQVRSDYPDVIANSPDGEFNAGFVRIYVRPTGGGDVLQFEGVVTPGAVSQQFTVGAIAGTNIGSGALPTRASADLCPYEPGNASYSSTTTAGSSTFSTNTYEVAIAFRYNNTITSINHADTDCIPEASLTFSQIYDAAKYYGAAVSTYSDLAALSASSVYDLQLRPVIDTHEIYNYRAATTTWESLVTPSVATVAALRLIPAPIAANKKYFVTELKKYTRYDTSLTGAETGNGIFKPYNLADNVAGRHIIEEVI
jgi:hypothetical protein